MLFFGVAVLRHEEGVKRAGLVDSEMGSFP